MNSGIENYRRTNLTIQQNTTNPADIYKNFPSTLSNQIPTGQMNMVHQPQPNQFVHQPQPNQFVPQLQPNQFQDQFGSRVQHNNLQMHPISTYASSNPNLGSNPNPVLSQIDLLEKDINNIFSNNITPDRLERLGSGIVANGQAYDIGSMNPKHQMLGEYEKPTNLIHNNISKNVFAETLQEYTIIVDSADRDIAKYPNPFSYRVKFNGLPGTPDANIMRKFDYVKYVKLDTGIIPGKYYYVKQDTSLNPTDWSKVKQLNLTSNPKNSTFALASLDISGSFALIDITDVCGNSLWTRYTRFCPVTTYPTQVDTIYEFIFDYTNPSDISGSGIFKPDGFITRYKLQPYSLTMDKYTLLYIDELTNPNENSTNDIVGKSFSVMFPDGCVGDSMYTSSGFIDKMFRFALLGQLNQMTISIGNSNGTILKNSPENYIDTRINPSKTCTCTTDTNGYFVRNYGCVCTYFRHPYYQKFQNTLIFRIGVIEPNIDKNIFS
jgi:hypothetical protein